MTTQAIFTAQTFGTSTNVGDQKFSIAPLTLTATTTAFVVSVLITLGTNQPHSKTTKVRVWYTTTTHTVSAADAPSKLGQTARYVDVLLDRPVAIADSTLEPVTGASFHAWATVPTQVVAGSLSATLVELP